MADGTQLAANTTFLDKIRNFFTGDNYYTYNGIKFRTEGGAEAPSIFANSDGSFTLDGEGDVKVRGSYKSDNVSIFCENGANVSEYKSLMGKDTVKIDGDDGVLDVKSGLFRKHEITQENITNGTSGNNGGDNGGNDDDGGNNDGGNNGNGGNGTTTNTYNNTYNINNNLTFGDTYINWGKSTGKQLNEYQVSFTGFLKTAQTPPENSTPIVNVDNESLDATA